MKRALAQQSVLLAIVGFGVLAGAAFIFVKVLVGELTPMQVVASRTIAGSVAVVGVMALTGTDMPRTRSFVKSAFVLGTLDGIAPYLLVAHAQVHVTSATAAILISTMPLFTTLFAWSSLRDGSVGPVVLTGIVAGFGGVALLVGPDALDVGSSNAAATAALLLAAACYAAATVYARGVLRTTTPLALTGAKLVVTAAAVTPVVLVADGLGNFTVMSSEGWGSLIALGFGSTGLGRAVYLWAVGKAGSVKASLVTYVAPVVAISLSWLLLGEEIDLRTLGGAGLIVAGVASVMFGRQLDASLRRVITRPPAPSGRLPVRSET